MSPKHGPWRARVTIGEAAQQQIDGFNFPYLIAVDRAIVRIQTDPEIGTLRSGSDRLREYREPGAGVRVVYHLTTSGAVYVDYVEA